THISQASGSGADEGTSYIPRVPDVPTDESEEELSWNSTDDEGVMKERMVMVMMMMMVMMVNKEMVMMIMKMMMVKEVMMMIIRKLDEESFNPIPKTPEDSDNEGNGEEDLELNVGREEGHNEEEEEDELYRDVNINQGRGIQTTQEVEDSHVTLTPVNLNGQQQSSSVSSQFVTSMLNPTLDVGMKSIFKTTSQMDVQTPTSVAPLPMTAPTMTPSTIATITTTSQAPFPPTTASSSLIQDLPNFGSLFGFDNRLRTLEANLSEFMQTNQFARAVSAIPGIVHRYMDQRKNEAVQKIIKEQDKEQVKVKVSKILPRIEQTVNEQLEAEVLTRSSHSSKTSYVVAADLSEMELKKILIEKMKGNKFIQCSDEQRNLYKALVDAYKSDKIILDTYGETVTLKRRCDDNADKDEEPSAGPDRGSKRPREGKEPESASAPTKTATKSAGSIQPWISELAKRSDSRSSFSKLMDTPLDFSNFLINRLKVNTLTLKLLAGPTYELMNGSCKSLVELEYHLEEVFKAITDQLDLVNPEGQQYPHNLLKPLPLIPNNQGHRVIPFDHFINNDLEYLRGGASSRKYSTFITKTKAADYGHIKWIEDLVPRTMWIEEPIGYDKHALWGRRVEDLQLGVKSYQKKLNLTKLDSYRSNLKCKEAYTAYSSPQGFIYHNKDKKNRLMRIDELHKFTDVRTALDDRLKGIRMQYLPQSIWRKSDKDKAVAMI
nr:hypothetical protein [Tanacetum cinerariifolium]